MKSVARTAVIALISLNVFACGDVVSTAPSSPTASNQPATAAMKDGKPVGLYFMTRYWMATGSLEKSVWYFTPDGTAYEQIQTGFSSEDLANHKGRKGSMSWDGELLVITWQDGKKTDSKIEIDKEGGGFAWDMGLFSPVTAFEDPKKIVGKYEGGESISFGGNSAMVIKSLELRPDGTFTWAGISSFHTKSEQSTVNTGGSSETTGTWELKGYTITLTDNKGGVQKSICFPYDDDKTPIYPDRTFLNGTMMKKLQ